MAAQPGGDRGAGGGVVRRALCRLGAHRGQLFTPAQLGHPATSCLHERRCVHCARSLGTAQIHHYGPARPTGDPCRKRTSCVRCGGAYTVDAHQRRQVFVRDLPPELRPRRFNGQSYGPCAYTWRCARCGEVEDRGYLHEEHDWRKTGFSHTCRRCGAYPGMDDD